LADSFDDKYKPAEHTDEVLRDLLRRGAAQIEQLLDVCLRLRQWGIETGGWEAPVWDDLNKVLLEAGLIEEPI
jgi:hypothetical protein